MNVKEFFFNKAIYFFFILMSLFFMRDTFVSRWSRMYAPDKMGSASFPRIVFIVTIILSIFFLVHFKEKNKLSEYFHLSNWGNLLALLYVITTLLLIFAVYYIGPIVSIFVYLVFWIYFLGYKNILHIVLMALVISLGINWLCIVGEIYFSTPLLF